MVEKIEELHLPNAVVLRLVKDALPDGVNISKEARAALARAASVYVLYLTSAATNAAKGKKTITAQHVVEALEEIEFESFVAPIKEALEVYRKSNQDKKERKSTAQADSGAPAADKNDENEVMEIDDDDEPDAT